MRTEDALFFIDDYRDLVHSAVYGHFEKNKRTGEGIHVMPGAGLIEVDMNMGVLPCWSSRLLYPKSATAEIAWFLMGSDEVKHLEMLGPKFWTPFADEHGKVPGAYGYRWRRHFGRDQIADAVNTLKYDPSSRQVYVSAWDPSKDGLGRVASNFPCPLGFTLGLKDGKLDMSVFMRSSDLIVGLPYDIMGHAMLLGVIAKTLKVEMGVMSFHLAHAHVYHCHTDTDILDPILEADSVDLSAVFFPEYTLEDVVDSPGGFVQEWRVACKAAGQGKDQDGNKLPDLKPRLVV